MSFQRRGDSAAAAEKRIAMRGTPKAMQALMRWCPWRSESSPRDRQSITSIGRLSS